MIIYKFKIKHFKNSNLWDDVKYLKADKKSQTFFSWGYLKDNIKTIKNQESNTTNEKNLTLKHIDETLLLTIKIQHLNKIEEGFENSDNKLLKNHFNILFIKIFNEN